VSALGYNKFIIIITINTRQSSYKQTLAHTLVGVYTGLGDHQGRPSTPTNSLHELHMARYQVIIKLRYGV